MKNIINRLLLNFFIIFLLFLPKKVIAEEWIKYDQNPILSAGSGDNHVAGPTLINDGGKLKMWYQGHDGNQWHIGYAESEDGINWQRPLSDPVLSPETTDQIVETGLVEPSVLKTDSYHMWFNSQNNGVYRIRHATSADGIHWQKKPAYDLVPEKAWESTNVANPSVIYKDGKYFMWYMAGGHWQIGLAESTDGHIWTKYENNPLNLPNLGHVGGQSVIYLENKYHMFYHTGGLRPTHLYHVISDDGINWSCDGNCSILSAPSAGFDSYMTLYPEGYNHNGKIYLYYTGHNGSLWQIGLATQQPITQTKQPIIIIPGLFASWNKQAVAYNQQVDINDWHLNPYVHEYDGLKQTLINLGYKENEDFYIFAYDWRKGLDNLADDLNSYTQQFSNLTMKQFSIIGHSLGGLVARIYAQKYGTGKINKIITIGSPHHGAAQAYKAVEAGEIDRYDNFLWLTQKLILQLNKDGIKTDRQVIEEKFPVAKDLLPTENFIKDSNNREISIAAMTVKNHTLLAYNADIADIPDLSNLFQTFAGEAGDTLAGFKVGQRTTLDRLLDYYPDGRPTENFSRIGDYLVLSSSARIADNNKIFNLGHGELIYKKEPIGQILTTLAIPYQENQISEGAGTTVSPALLFLILSPAEMKVEFDNNTYMEKDGLIFIENAAAGDYRLALIGKEKGSYRVIIGQITNNHDLWTSLSGEITSNPPDSQTDTYAINFDSQNPLDFPINQNDVFSLFDLLNLKLNLIKKEYKHSDLEEAIEELRDAKKNFLKKNYKQTRKQLIETQNEIFSVRKKAPLIYKNSLYDGLSQLENLYEQTAKTADYSPNLQNLNKQSAGLAKKLAVLENYLLQRMDRNKKINEKTQSLLSMKEKLLKESEAKDRPAYREILLLSVSKLSKEIKQ